VLTSASRSASLMISSDDLRKISARSRGFLAAQPGNAALAASTAALASSTVALATEATLFSVAGSITSKRPPSEDFRHLPPIHRSVGTLASRLSYIAMVAPVLCSFPPLISAKAEIQNYCLTLGPRFRRDEQKFNSPSRVSPGRRSARRSAAQGLPECQRPAKEYAA